VVARTALRRELLRPWPAVLVLKMAATGVKAGNGLHLPPAGFVNAGDGRSAASGCVRRASVAVMNDDTAPVALGPVGPDAALWPSAVEKFPKIGSILRSNGVYRRDQDVPGSELFRGPRGTHCCRLIEDLLT
jgi:hypothetical protein